MNGSIVTLVMADCRGSLSAGCTSFRRLVTRLFGIITIPTPIQGYGDGDDRSVEASHGSEKGVTAIL